jgi:DNA polymerase I
MWILDVCTTQKGLDLWVKDGSTVRRRSETYNPSFYLALADPHAHWQMLEDLESRYGACTCTFTTVYGPREGYCVWAGRRIAEGIEQQTRYAAELYNVDIRAEQRYFAAQNRFPCGYPGESRFRQDFEIPLESLEIRVNARPHRDRELGSARVSAGGECDVLTGSGACIVGDLLGLVEAHDPDIILFPHADYWMHHISETARNAGFDETFSRSGKTRELGAKSYWSYGRREYRAAAVIPEGRLLIDTEESFVYREGGLSGVLLASRLTCLSPNLTSRFTPGTLVSGYEVYEALRRGIAIPFRKSDPERLRRCAELRTADRGGMMFQPVPGIYGPTHQLDFTSLYPSIIVKYNLSPETLDAPEMRGFLAEALAPLLAFRIRTKRLKKTTPAYAGIDGVLKWMLVTCFGYTGYRNAKFGRIEMHERITQLSREILLTAKETADQMGFAVLHGIVDCLWVQGDGVGALKARIEEATGIPTECEAYDWIVFLPQADGSGAYNRYYGLLADGTIKVRGIAARRKDMPPYIVRMQHDLLAMMGEATTLAELKAREDRIRAVYLQFREGIGEGDIADFVIKRRISRLSYERNCIEGAAVRAFRRRGIDLSPGMVIGYVVRDAGRWLVDPDWDAACFDRRYYRELLDRAWEEVAFAFRRPRDP